MTDTNMDTVTINTEAEGQELTLVADTKPELTPKQHRKLMRQFWTVTHSRALCGHQLDLSTDPRTNCQICWFTWFNQHGDLVQTCDEMFQKHGIATITTMRGAKFSKMYLRFMATLAAGLKEVKDVSSTEGIAASGSTKEPEARA